MKFEEALKAMREGKKVTLPKEGSAKFFLKPHTSKKGTEKLLLMCKHQKTTERVKTINATLITTADWEIVDND
jgi:hypothetical protein